MTTLEIILIIAVVYLLIGDILCIVFSLEGIMETHDIILCKLWIFIPIYVIKIKIDKIVDR